MANSYRVRWVIDYSFNIILCSYGRTTMKTKMTLQEAQCYELTRPLNRKINILKTLLKLAIGYSITLTWLAHEFASENNRLTYDLNVSQAAFKIQSSVVKKITEENKGLRKANDCLIKYSHRDRCITAIKHTPLPPLVKEK